MSRWLLLTYRIPREPTAGRVFVWRKLKQLGAIALQDAAREAARQLYAQVPLDERQWCDSDLAELDG